MKPQITCTYLYSDGHAVRVFEKQDRDAGRVQFAEIFERFTLAPAGLSFTGRIIFGRYAGALAEIVRRHATGIRADAASARNGSEATRKAGIVLGDLMIDTAFGRLHLHEFPDLLSGEYTYQPDVIEAFNPDASTWADHRVARVHRLPAPAVAGRKEVAA